MHAALDHVGLSVSDLAAATEWWCRALGLAAECPVEPPGTDLTGVMLVHPSGYRVELLHRPRSLAFPPPTGPVEAACRRRAVSVVEEYALPRRLTTARHDPGGALHPSGSR